MRLNLDKEEIEEEFKFKISDKEESELKDFMKNNSELLGSKISLSISSVMKLFNILDTHLEYYCG